MFILLVLIGYTIQSKILDTSPQNVTRCRDSRTAKGRVKPTDDSIKKFSIHPHFFSRTTCTIKIHRFSCCSHIVSASAAAPQLHLLPDCVRFSLLLRDCVHFSCYSLTVSTSAAVPRVCPPPIAAPQLCLLQLLLLDCVPLQLLLLECVRLLSHTCSTKYKYEGCTSLL